MWLFDCFYFWKIYIFNELQFINMTLQEGIERGKLKIEVVDYDPPVK